MIRRPQRDLFFLLAVLMLNVYGPTGRLVAYAAPPEKTSKQEEGASAERQIDDLRSADKRLDEPASQPMPPNLSVKEKKKWQSYDRWLNKTSKDLYILADDWEKDLTSRNKPDPSASKLQQITPYYTSQYFAMLKKISQEDRQFAKLSSPMKTKQDKAKKAISDLR